MSVRLPSLPPTILAAAVGLFALTSALTAQPPAKPTPAAPPSSDTKSVGDLRTPQEQNAELFRKFQRELLSLAQKLERSDRPEDKERAKVIYAALDLSRKENVEAQFQKIIAGIAKGTATVRDLEDILGQDKQLTKALQDILTILMTDDESARIKAEIAKLEAFLKEARAILRQQQTIRAMTDAQKGKADRLAKDQDQLAGKTKDLGDRMGGDKKDGKQGDGQGGKEGIAKSDPKGEAKPGESAGDPKADTQEAKADAKGSEGGDPTKAGENADGEGKGAGQEGEPKDGAGGKPGDGEPKDGAAGAPRDAGQPKDGQGISEPKPGEGQGKEGAKPVTGQPKEGKPGDGQTGSKEGKPGEGQQGSQGGKPSGQQGEGKGQGQGKGEAKGSQGKGGESKGKGQPGQQGEQQASSKGGGQQGGQQGGQEGQQGQQGQQANQTPGRKSIEEAYPHQRGATEDLKKNEREKAGKKEDSAIEKIAQAIDELEKRLKQLREEEMLKLLANLEARCNRMLQMQIEVYEATKAIDAVVVKNNNQKTTAEVQKAQQQADKEQEIVAEADKALKLLMNEGSAVAFATVLEEVRQDMIAVQRRLADARVGRDTQVIEENIIALLGDMIAALKRAQQEIQQQQKQGPPPGPQKPGNRRLIDLLAELKLIRTLQVQVNTRTKSYGGQYTGEQAGDPLIQAELRQLSERQVKIEEMLDKLAKGDNQ